MQEGLINYETNFNLSSKYSDVTPFKVTPENENDVEHKNLPFFYIEGAKNDTCEKWEKMEDPKFKRNVALYVMEFAHENDTDTFTRIIAPLQCRLDKEGDTLFEIGHENADFFMEVMNPEYVDSKKQIKSKILKKKFPDNSTDVITSRL